MPGKVEKQFSPRRSCCEARAGLFMCQERLRKQFSPLWLCCEARGGLFKWQERLRSSFHHGGGAVYLVQAC